MLTKDDVLQIGKVIEGNNKVLRVELAQVIDQNVMPVLDEVHSDVKDIQTRLTIVEHKLDRALYHELDRHERWIKQLAAKVGVELVRE